MGKPKITEVTAYARDDAVLLSVCRGLFGLSQILQGVCYRRASVFKKPEGRGNPGCSIIAQNARTMLMTFYNILREDVIIFLFFLEKKLDQKGEVKYVTLDYVLMAELKFN